MRETKDIEREKYREREKVVRNQKIETQTDLQ